MILSFRDTATEDIFDGRDSKAARRALPSYLHRRASELMDRLNAAVSPRSLAAPSLRLEKLRGDRRGQYSVRINDQYRICFRWSEDGVEDVEIVDYH